MKEEELDNLRKVVKLGFIRTGLRRDLTGYDYLCHAVELVVKNPDLIHSLCKDLYRQVGEYFKTQNTSSVERSIRNAIDNTFINRSFSELNKMFNASLFSVNEKPTAGELIGLMADYYRLGLYKGE